MLTTNPRGLSTITAKNGLGEVTSPTDSSARAAVC